MNGIAGLRHIAVVPWLVRRAYAQSSDELKEAIEQYVPTEPLEVSGGVRNHAEDAVAVQEERAYALPIGYTPKE